MLTVNNITKKTSAPTIKNRIKIGNVNAVVVERTLQFVLQWCERMTQWAMSNSRALHESILKRKDPLLSRSTSLRIFRLEDTVECCQLFVHPDRLCQLVKLRNPFSCVHFHPVVEKTIVNKILAILVLFCLRKSQHLTTMEIPLRNVQQQLSKLFSKSMASSCLCCIFNCEHQNQPWPSLQQNPQKVLHDFVWISNVNPIKFKFHCILDFVLLGFLLLGVLCVVQICGDRFLFVRYFEIWHQSNCAFQIHPKFRFQFPEEIPNENCAFKHNTNVPKTLVVNHSFTSLVDLGFHITVPTIRKTCQLLCQSLELQLALFFCIVMWESPAHFECLQCLTKMSECAKSHLVNPNTVVWRFKPRKIEFHWHHSRSTCHVGSLQTDDQHRWPSTIKHCHIPIQLTLLIFVKIIISFLPQKSVQTRQTEEETNLQHWQRKTCHASQKEAKIWCLCGPPHNKRTCVHKRKIWFGCFRHVFVLFETTIWIWNSSEINDYFCVKSEKLSLFVVVIVFVFVVILLLLYFVFVIDFYEFVLWIFLNLFCFSHCQDQVLQVVSSEAKLSPKESHLRFCSSDKKQREKKTRTKQNCESEKVSKEKCVCLEQWLSNHMVEIQWHIVLIFIAVFSWFFVSFCFCCFVCCCAIFKSLFLLVIVVVVAFWVLWKSFLFCFVLFVCDCANCCWLLLVVVLCCLVDFCCCCCFVFVLLKMKLKFNLFCCLQQQTVKIKFFQIWLFWQRQHKVKTWNLIACEKKTKTQSTKEIEMRICVLFCVWDLTKIGSKIKITNWKQNPASNLFVVTKKFRSNKSEMTIKEVQGLFWCSQSKISQKTLFISNQKQQKKMEMPMRLLSKEPCNDVRGWHSEQWATREPFTRVFWRERILFFQGAPLCVFFVWRSRLNVVSSLFIQIACVNWWNWETPLMRSFPPCGLKDHHEQNPCHPCSVLCAQKSTSDNNGNSFAKRATTTLKTVFQVNGIQLSLLHFWLWASKSTLSFFETESKKVLHDFVWISNVNSIEFKFHCILDFVLLGFSLLGVLCVVHLWRSIFVCEIFWNLTPKQLCISDSSKIQVSISRKTSNENCAFKHNTNVPKTLVVNHSFTSLVDLGFHITVSTIRKTCQLLCQPLELQLALFFSLWCERVLLILSVCSVWQRWVNVPNHILSIQTQLCEGSNQEKTSSIDTILAWHVTLVHCKLMINTGDLPQSNIATSQSNWHFSSSSKSSSPSSHKRVCKQDRLKKKRICSTDKEKRAMQAKKKRKFGVCVVHHTTRGHVFTKEKSDLGVFVMCLCCLKPQFEFGIHQK